uniref:H/ACA snoRNP protein NHP2 n=1 Tax=Thermobia domestica TaxID=89055 RepID=A0A481SXS8_THEDO|nr:putative NHP2 protein [Thermobia domestica]
MGKDEKRKRSQEDDEDEQIIKKSKGDDDDNVAEEEKELSYEEKLHYVSVIANPMAPKKLAKKLYKLIKKASKKKTFLRYGLRDVQSRIRKGETGIVIFAGDVTPVDIMCHMPVVCEDKNIPYIYTPSRQDLGTAMGVRRGCVMMMIRKHDEYADLFDYCVNEIKQIPLPL